MLRAHGVESLQDHEVEGALKDVGFVGRHVLAGSCGMITGVCCCSCGMSTEGFGEFRGVGMEGRCGSGEVGRASVRHLRDQHINGRITPTSLGFWGAYGGLEFLEGLE